MPPLLISVVAATVVVGVVVPKETWESYQGSQGAPRGRRLLGVKAERAQFLPRGRQPEGFASRLGERACVSPAVGLSAYWLARSVCTFFLLLLFILGHLPPPLVSSAPPVIQALAPDLLDLDIGGETQTASVPEAQDLVVSQSPTALNAGETE